MTDEDINVLGFEPSLMYVLLLSLLLLLLLCASRPLPAPFLLCCD